MRKRLIHFEELIRFQRRFVAARSWDVFHTPKNLAMALAGEAGELLELFQWLTPEESQAISSDKKKREAISDELADILWYTFRIADKLGIDPNEAMAKKWRKNAKRYPVRLARGNARKYTELRPQKKG